MTFADLELGDRFSFKDQICIKVPLLVVKKYRKNALVIAGKDMGEWKYVKPGEDVK